MPRCPTGTRKNKITGNCDKTSSKPQLSKKQKLTEKLEKCITEKNRQKDATNRKKYYELEEKCSRIMNEIENLDTSKTLDESVIESIIDQYVSHLESSLKDELREKMRKLTYDKKYRSCFSSEPSVNLYHQVVDKLACYVKYGDKIE